MQTIHIVDAIIGLVFVEMVALILFRRTQGKGMRQNEVVSFLGAGTGLLVALRVLLSDGPFVWFGAAMLVSLVMHLWHIRLRWSGA